MSLINISQYLSKKEAFSLKETLFNNGIDSIIITQGKNVLSYFDSTGSDHMLQIHNSDFEKALPIVQEFNEMIEKKRIQSEHLLTKQCPHCKSLSIHIHEKKSIFDKALNFGVTVWECNDCHKKWFT